MGNCIKSLNESSLYFQKQPVKPLPTPFTTHQGKDILDIDFHSNWCATSDPCQHLMIVHYTDGTTRSEHIDAIDIKRFYRNFIKPDDHHFDYITPEYIAERIITL
jgi:hypothetical protein